MTSTQVSGPGHLMRVRRTRGSGPRRPQAVSATVPPFFQPRWTSRGFARTAVELGGDVVKLDLARAARSSLRGRYWPSSPLVCSLLARCQGERQLAEVHLDAGLAGEALVGGELASLVPGQRLDQLRSAGRRCAARAPRRRASSSGRSRGGRAAHRGSVAPRASRSRTGRRRRSADRPPSDRGHGGHRPPAGVRRSAPCGRSGRGPTSSDAVSGIWAGVRRRACYPPYNCS